MNFKGLKKALGFLFSEGVVPEIIVYAKLKNIDQIKKFDIEAEALPGISEMFLNSIKSRIFDEAGHILINLSTADERGKCFYRYDLELPPDLKYLENVIGNDSLDKFSFANNKLEEIEFLII